jgi:hypothetical protein
MYCLHKFRILPSQFLDLDQKDKAFIIAAINLKIEAEKEEAKKIKK